MSDFQAFEKIQPFHKVWLSITQKIHGTNGQIHIYKKEDETLDLKVGSRTRWITPESDNYGFAQFVCDNKPEILEKLGLGTHFGEWAGQGINTGEGLKQRMFLLFNVRRWAGKELPTRFGIVPQLYSGTFSKELIDITFERLRQDGSSLVPGYMHPEGIVIDIDGKLYKRVFQPEETQWTAKQNVAKAKAHTIDVSHLLQPIRLEKLISRDEIYLREYPKSLVSICKDYVADLESEQPFDGTDEEIKALKKALGAKIFLFVKAQMNTYAAR